MAKVYLGLGTNLGDKEQNLRDAVQKIEEQIGKVVSLSAFYITAPWGFTSENSFLNAANLYNNFDRWNIWIVAGIFQDVT